MRIRECRDRDGATAEIWADFDLTAAQARQRLEHAPPKVLEIAESDARWVEETYGVDSLGPYSDLESLIRDPHTVVA
jgi:hypothetical protein